MTSKLTPANCIAERVRLNAQGYDRNGRYWGVGEPLYALTPHPLGHVLISKWGTWANRVHFRGANAKAARALASEAYTCEAVESARPRYSAIAAVRAGYRG